MATTLRVKALRGFYAGPRLVYPGETLELPAQSACDAIRAACAVALDPVAAAHAAHELTAAVVATLRANDRWFSIH